MVKDDLKTIRVWIDSSISLSKEHLYKVKVKPVLNEGDCLRCPYCGSLVMGKYGFCDDCGERYGV